jgi:hypothetical protein
MQPVGIELKSPLSPFFKGGFFSAGFQPLFGKEGLGEIFGRFTREYVANF